MEDKVFLATAKTEETLTDEQLLAAAEHGWQAMPHPAAESSATFLLRPVQSEDEATGQLADLLRDHRLADLLSISSTPYVSNPLYAPASPPQGIRGTSEPDDQQQPGPAEEKPGTTDGAAGKGGRPPDEPPTTTTPQADAFPTIPEYLWQSLKPESQEELAKKLVEYVVDRPNTAAFRSGFDDAALFAHLEAGERSDLAKGILEQKHGMTTEQVRRESLTNDFQVERVNLMKSAVHTAMEINEHLKKWRDLSNHVVPILMWSAIVAGVFVLASFWLVFVGRISGWEMSVLVFVFALMAVSPATLLLIGRPLKGLDEWSPSKQATKAEEAAKEAPAKEAPANSREKSDEKAGK